MHEIKILGVTVQDNLSFKTHSSNVCQASAQCLYALKILKAKGLTEKALQQVCQALVISRLTYASPAWWGFATADDKQTLNAVLKRATKWGFYGTTMPSLDHICQQREDDLFDAILNKPSHVLHSLLPPNVTHTHNLRPRPHTRQLPSKNSTLLSRNFLFRMLYKNKY